MKTFFRGALLLIVAAFIGECVDFFINMTLARELGEEGLGLYMAILPTIVLIAVLASLELPISISKFIAEKDKKYYQSMLRHALRFVFLFTLFFLVIAALVLPHITIFDRYHPFVIWLVLLLIPIASFSAVAKGYFMGSHQMGKIAFSNLFEKVIQLVLLVFIFQLFQFNQEVSVLIALCALIGKEVVVFIYLITVFIIQFYSLKRGPTVAMSGKTVREQLLAVSLPTTGVRIFHAVTFAIKPFLIKEALVRSGLTEAMAMAQYGKLAGVAFTIGFFPAFIAHSLLIVLIPTVSEAYAKKDFAQLQNLLKKVMMLTCVYGIPAVFIFYFFADPLTSMFFENSPAKRYLQLLTPYFLFHFFVIPMQAYLIGLGLVKDALAHAVWATLISFLMMFFLGSTEQLQMDGIIIGMNISAVLLTLMHYLTICEKINITPLLKTKKLLK